LIITQNGEAKAVVQDIVSYEKKEETMALLKILALPIAISKKAATARQKMCSPTCASD